MFKGARSKSRKGNSFRSGSGGEHRRKPLCFNCRRSPRQPSPHEEAVRFHLLSVPVDGLPLCRSKRKLYLCKRWGFQPPQRLLLSPAAYELPARALARHPDLVKIVAVSIPTKR
jgi:hypothetical protein